MKDLLLEAVNALVLAKGNTSLAAQNLNIPRSTLVTRISEAERENKVPTVKSPE